jgi:hypothetical protein
VASPFAVFRRNQKILLAVLGIGAMIAFVFLDPLMKYVGRSGKQENPVVVETKYGALKESDLANMRASRELLEAFLQRVSSETISAQVRDGVLDPRLAETAYQRWYLNWQQTLMGRSTPSPEESAVETLVLSKKAQQLGIVVSDRAINDFLKQVSGDSLTSDSLQQIIDGLQGQRRVSAVRLFEAIRTEMLASKVAELFAQSLRDIPPAQKFEYYCRLYRRAKIELAPLAVADFVAQVSDPPAAELDGFFEKYKDRYAEPTSPEPGFKEPKRATFQYFKADFAKFKEQFLPQVTDAEIAEYYEKNKEQFRELQQEAKPEGTEESTEKPADSPAESAPDPEKSEDKPSGDTPDQPKEDANKPADQPPADKQPEEGTPKQSSGAIGPSRFRLVSAPEADQKTKGEPGGETETPQPKSEPAGDAEKTGPSLEPKPADAPSADKDEPAPDDKPGESTEAKDAPAEEAKREEPKYEPLEKVKEQIRGSIAARKANEKITEIFDELTGQMRRYADEVDAYNASKGADSRGTPPKPFPFAELAKEKGLEARELPMVTAAEAAAEDLGQLRRSVRDSRSQFGIRAEPFTTYAFAESFPTYRTDVQQDNDGNVYLYWKTEEKAAYVPTLDEVKEKVVRAWKMIKARDLARKRGEEYAAQARQAQKTLKEALANQPHLTVSETDWFSWMTMGNVPFDPTGGRPRLSTVEGVSHAGQTFMHDVFALSPNDIGVTSNEPRDTVYIVRLAEYEKPTDELRQDFAGERQPRYLMVALSDQRQIYDAWLKNLEKDAGVHWMRKADIARRGRVAEPEQDMDF